MSDQRQFLQEQLPIGLEKAEFIISLILNRNPPKVIIHLLHEIQQQCEGRHKKNQEFYQVVQLIQEQRSKLVYASEQLITKLEDDKTCLKADIIQLNSRKTSLLTELSTFESALSDIRTYAEQRRNKKSKRERQYHQFYNVPLISDQYKKKYLRARDKNLDAEERVSELRTTVDSCQKAINEVAKAISDVQKDQEQLTAKQEGLHYENMQNKRLIEALQDASLFWKNFDQHRRNAVEAYTAQLIETVQRHTSRIHSVNTADLLNQYKAILFDYEKEEVYGERHWGNIQIDFECAKCRQTLKDWPRLDKVHKTDFLCNNCYQEYRRSMIWERKMNGVRGRSQQLMSIPSSSMLSISSFSSANSNASKISGKSGFKDIFKKFKLEKRKSSIVEPTTTSATLISS